MSKPEKADARGGKFELLPYCLLKSEAWRTASPRAIKALLVLYGRHTGYNNGRIALSLADLAVGMDSQNHRGNARALAELHARGIAVIEHDHPRGSRLAREYRLTFVPTKDQKATHDYLNWRDGDAGTRKKCAVETANETALSSAETAKEEKLSVAETANEKLENNAKPPFLLKGSFADSAVHIGNHLGGSSDRQSRSSKIAAGVFAENEPFSAAPPLDELRARSRSHIERHGYGAQGRLAMQAKIRAPEFSKFMNGGPLNQQARIRLACAFPRTEEVERRGVA